MIKFKQVAICIPSNLDHQATVRNIKKYLGGEIYTDELIMNGNINDIEYRRISLMLSFHHGLFDGIEVELITSESFEHWHHNILEQNGGIPFLSHFGSYLSSKDFDSTVKYFTDNGFPILQNTKSDCHSHPREDGTERHYQDIIFDTSILLGFNIKITRKV